MPGQPRRVTTGYSDEFKAAVLADLAAGSSIFVLKRKYGIAGQTIKQWSADYNIARGPVSRESIAEELGSMVFKYTKKNLRAMMAIADMITDKEWLRAQNAEGLALLTSTIHDKTVGLLANMQANADRERALLEANDEPERLEADDDYTDDEPAPAIDIRTLDAHAASEIV